MDIEKIESYLLSLYCRFINEDYYAPEVVFYILNLALR